MTTDVSKLATVLFEGDHNTAAGAVGAFFGFFLIGAMGLAFSGGDPLIGLAAALVGALAFGLGKYYEGKRFDRNDYD